MRTTKLLAFGLLAALVVGCGRPPVAPRNPDAPHKPPQPVRTRGVNKDASALAALLKQDPIQLYLDVGSENDAPNTRTYEAWLFTGDDEGVHFYGAWRDRLLMDKKEARFRTFRRQQSVIDPMKYGPATNIKGNEQAAAVLIKAIATVPLHQVYDRNGESVPFNQERLRELREFLQSQ